MSTDAMYRPMSGELPEEFYLDGPVPGGEELFRRTVARVHRHAARSARLRTASLVATVVVAGALVMGAGMELGHWMSRPGDERVLVATDADGGATLTADLVPVDGGSHVELKVTGLPAGTECHLTLYDKQGAAVADGSWGIGPDGGSKPVDMNAWPPPDDISSVMVTTSTGLRLSGPVG